MACARAAHYIARVIAVRTCGTDGPSVIVLHGGPGAPGHACVAADDESLEDDERGRHETWDDMLRVQADGVYPAEFRAIRSPVLMLHGAYDPHPGAMIRDSLAPFIAQLEYYEWERCGHYPWREHHARDDFFARMRAWLMATTPDPRARPSRRD